MNGAKHPLSEDFILKDHSEPGTISEVGRCLRLDRNEIATKKVTIVPKQIHQGNFISGSQVGWV